MSSIINERIKQLIKNENLTYSGFAEKIGISESSLKSMFNRGTAPSYDTLEKIASAYRCYSLLWLLTGEGEMLSGANVQTTEGNTGSGIVGNNVNGGGGINNNQVSGGGISQNDEGVMHKLLDIIREKDAALASKDAQIERLLDIILKEHAQE